MINMACVLLKSHSTPKTVKWLEEHYKVSDGISIPRSVMYLHYVQFCQGRLMRPVNAASFGKIVRQKFPGLTSRRLGTRGLSRYHYNGLGLKWEAELLTHISPAAALNFNNLDRGLGLTIEMTDGVYQFNASQSFPSKDILNRLPRSIPKKLVEQLLDLYTQHSVNLVDSATATDPQHSNVLRCIENFWDDFPVTLKPLLENNAVISLLGVVDTIAFRSIGNAVIPSCLLGEVPISRADNLLHLTENIIICLRGSSTIRSVTLWRLKIHWAKIFQYTVQRLSELNQLCWTLNEKFEGDSSQGQMLRDWRKVDMVLIIAELGFIFESLPNSSYYEEVIWTLCNRIWTKIPVLHGSMSIEWSRFEAVLRSSVSICTVKAWMHVFIHPCVTEYIGANKNTNVTFGCFKESASRVLLLWSAVGTRILRELTLSVAESFGTFNYLYQIMSDYGAHLMESLIVDEHLNALQANIGIGHHPELAVANINGIICNSKCPCRIPFSRDSNSTESAEQKAHRLDVVSVIQDPETVVLSYSRVLSSSDELDTAKTGDMEPKSDDPLKLYYAPNEEKLEVDNPCSSASCLLGIKKLHFPFQIYERSIAHMSRIGGMQSVPNSLSYFENEQFSKADTVGPDEDGEIKRSSELIPETSCIDYSLISAVQRSTLQAVALETGGEVSVVQQAEENEAVLGLGTTTCPTQYFETEEAMLFLREAFEAGRSWLSSIREEDEPNSVQTLGEPQLVDEAVLGERNCESENEETLYY